MISKEKFEKALADVRKQEEERHKKRNFDQTIDLIINLKNFDVRKNAINTIVTLPHKVKDKKIAGFLENKSEAIDSITKEEFDLYKDKKKLKNLVNKYDFFIANAKLMPAIATNFGRVLGPLGKMPSPQMGILMKEDDNNIKELADKINSVVKIRQSEPCLKIAIGKQSSKDQDIVENALKIYNEVWKNLPRQKENLKSILIKTTMGKPARIKI